ncbi:amidohydrolase family protein [Yinghuangia aomiensis]|uniref:Amidohydrolase family protein n=1 Tax=Yinghuangia aomiensis TaxID=676205 RepID=A0ABP9I4K3_9ACTN
MTGTTRHPVISCDSHVHVQPQDLRARLTPDAARAYDDALAAAAAERRYLLAGVDVSGLRMEHRAADRSGAWEPKARLADMDADGIDTEILFPEVSDFVDFHTLGSFEHQARDAYNACLRDFTATAPDRLIAAWQVGIHDVGHAVSDVRRLAAAGARLVQIPLHPREIGAPDYWDPRYEPLWTALEETRLPLAQHTATKASTLAAFRRDPTPQFGLTLAQVPFTLSENLAGWILGGVLERHPGLRIVVCEPLVGWLPSFLDLLDDMCGQGYTFPALREAPSAYFRRQVYVTFINEPRAVAVRHEIGLDHLLWSSDYPHPASTWPDSPHVLRSQMVTVPRAEQEALFGGNSARLFNLGRQP